MTQLQMKLILTVGLGALAMFLYSQGRSKKSKNSSHL